MITIKEYPLPLNSNPVPMPQGAEILKIEWQNMSNFKVFVRCETNNPLVIRTINAYMSNEDLADITGTYITSYSTVNASWHFFDMGETPLDPNMISQQPTVLV